MAKKEDLDIEEDLDIGDDLDKDTTDELDDDDLFNDTSNDDFFGEGSTPPVQKHKDLLKELTNFAPYLKDTFNNWLGLLWSEEDNKYVKNKLVDPVMTLKGAVWCSGLLKTYARNNNIITDISTEEYKNMMGDIIESIWLNLGTRTELGIKQEGDLIEVANQLEHAAALALMGAGDGKYNKMLGTTFTHSSSDRPMQGMGGVNINLGRKRGGIINRIKRGIMG